MFLLLFKNFISSRSVIIGMVILLTAGAVSFYIGNRHLQKQQAAIQATIRFQHEHIERNVRFFDKDMGLLLYYLRFAYVNEASPLNALSIGQRDVSNNIQFVTIRNLEGQKYDTDLFNPSNLLAGNLDFGFVLIYLFPLFIISVTYNLLSEEKENGTWKLVSVQSAGPVAVLLQKLGIRVGVVFGMLAVLLLSAGVVLSVPFNTAFAATAVLAFLYTAFWFAVCFWVVSWQKPSSNSAVSLLSIWVLLTIVAPGVVNNYIINRYPVPEALATAVANREGYHEKWDIDKGITMQKFYRHYPQFKNYPVPQKQSSWLWYYAMQQMGDDDARQQSAGIKQKLRLRGRASNLIAVFFPPLHAQLQLNSLSGAGLDNQLRFLDGTEQFHERKRLYFYPRIFEEMPVEKVDWKGFGAEYFTEKGPVDWIALCLPLLLITTVLGFLCVLNFSIIKRFV